MEHKKLDGNKIQIDLKISHCLYRDMSKPKKWGPHVARLLFTVETIVDSKACTLMFILN